MDSQEVGSRLESPTSGLQEQLHRLRWDVEPAEWHPTPLIWDQGLRGHPR